MRSGVRAEPTETRTGSVSKVLFSALLILNSQARKVTVQTMRRGGLKMGMESTNTCAHLLAKSGNVYG